MLWKKFKSFLKKETNKGIVTWDDLNKIYDDKFNQRPKCHECKFDEECHKDTIDCKDFIFKYDKEYEEAIIDKMRKKLKNAQLIKLIENKSW